MLRILKWWLFAVLAQAPIVDHLRSSLLTEASARQEARTVANGKFPLSTGAWYMTDKYAKQASGIELFANGTRVCAAGASKSSIYCGYRLDEKLVPCLGVHFGRGTVTELGAGVGRYQQAVLSLGRVPAYTAYDGMPDIQTLTSGRVGWADLSVVQGTRILRSDHALSLEVAEHIPPQYETNYLDNLDLANRRGLVLSWSRWGAKQSGHGHVNPKTPEQVKALLKRRGYRFDTNATRVLRKCASVSYLRTGILAFTRDLARPQGSPSN